MAVFDDDPGLLLGDKDGNMRIGLAVTEHEGANLTFLDADEDITYELPPGE